MKLSDVECPKGLLILLMKVKYFINFGHIMQCISKKIFILHLIVKINSEFRIPKFRKFRDFRPFRIPNFNSEKKFPSSEFRIPIPKIKIHFVPSLVNSMLFEPSADWPLVNRNNCSKYLDIKTNLPASNGSDTSARGMLCAIRTNFLV